MIVSRPSKNGSGETWEHINETSVNAPYGSSPCQDISPNDMKNTHLNQYVAVGQTPFLELDHRNHIHHLSKMLSHEYLEIG
jgi:hypothetical protein